MSSVFNFRCRKCGEKFGVRAARRPHAPMCPHCHSNDTDTLSAVPAVGMPNKPHSQWLAVVDRLTLDLYVSMLYVAGSTDSAGALANVSAYVNSLRIEHGLDPLSSVDDARMTLAAERIAANTTAL